MRGYSKKLNITEELLVEMYETMTMQQIAEELGVSYKTIQRRFKEYNIVTHKPTKKKRKKLKKKPKYQNKKDFQKVYSELRSLSLVAKHYNIDPKTAWKWKNKHNIETIVGVSEHGKRLRDYNKPYTDKEWLEKMYETMTLQEIADSICVHVSTIQWWCKELGVHTRSVAEQRALKSGQGNRTVYSMYTNEFSKDNYLDRISKFPQDSIPRTWKDYILKIVGECQCCGYKDVLDLHHIDENHHNNDPYNLSVLCPNCHAKIHRLGKRFDELVPNYESWIDKI